jgi:hypothetical protein
MLTELWALPFEALAHGKIEHRVKVLIPDTIIYEDTVPIGWYFNSKDGMILQKNKDKLTVATITARMEDLAKSNVTDGTGFCAVTRNPAESTFPIVYCHCSWQI